MKRHSLVKLNATMDHVHIMSFGYDLSPLISEVSGRFNVKVDRKYQGIMDFEVKHKENKNQEVISYITEFFTFTGWEPYPASNEATTQYQYQRCADE